MKKTLSAFFALCLSLAGPSVSQAQFAAQQTWCTGACVGGSANAITLAVPNIGSISDLVGVPVRFIPTAANTGATTIAAGGTAAIPVKKASFSSPVALSGGELPVGSPVSVVYDGSEYILIAGGFTTGGPALSAPISYFVSNSGSDGNSCLSAITPCLTIQHALTLVNNLNLNGYAVTINLADGVYSPITLPLINGSGSVIINGDAAIPANTVIFNNTTGSAINAGATVGYTIQNVLLETTANSGSDPGVGLWVQGANIKLNNVYYGPCSGGFIYAVAGYVALFGNMVISGGVPGNSLVPGAAFEAFGGAIILVSPTKVAITVSTPVTIQYFVLAIENGNINLLYSTLTGGANVTGTRYLASLNGTISTQSGGASYYPGTIAGSALSGGQYN